MSSKFGRNKKRELRRLKKLNLERKKLISLILRMQEMNRIILRDSGISDKNKMSIYNLTPYWYKRKNNKFLLVTALESHEWPDSVIKMCIPLTFEFNFNKSLDSFSDERPIVITYNYYDFVRLEEIDNGYF